MRITAFCLCLAVLISSSATLCAQDANNGRLLSERWCLSCHVTSHHQRTATDAVPSFESIARMEAFSGEKLAFYLLVPHPMMPYMSLSRDEAKDIAEYIVLQKN